jgi:hypothetical protein
VLRGGDHAGYQVLQAGAQGEGEVVHGFFGDTGDFMLGAYGAHGGSEEAGVEGGFGGLFAGAVFVGAVGLVCFVCALEGFFFGLGLNECFLNWKDE